MPAALNPFEHARYDPQCARVDRCQRFLDVVSRFAFQIFWKITRHLQGPSL